MGERALSFKEICNSAGDKKIPLRAKESREIHTDLARST
jgi:hypothetical protein